MACSNLGGQQFFNAVVLWLVFRVLFLLLLLLIFSLYVINNNNNNSKFKLENDRFILDGEPIRLVSGSIHYFRIHPGYWEDRLKRVKSIGLNAIEFFIPWNFHEQEPGVFLWDDWQNIEHFLTLAHQLNLLVLIRPGPYSCGEWENGGLPPWLLNPNVTGKPPQQIKFRSSDPTYIFYVQRWWSQLLPRLKKYLYENGGPIIMVQIENEFGFFGPDKKYLKELIKLAKKYLGKKVILYTTDHPGALYWGTLKGGEILTTVDFGAEKLNPNKEFEMAKKYNVPGKSAPICTELYTSPNSVELSNGTNRVLNSMGGTGSLNYYMAYGGTSFGFWAGGSLGFRLNESYSPSFPSYSYNEIIAEGGGYGTPENNGQIKYFAIRDTLNKTLQINLPEIMDQSESKTYGNLKFEKFVPFSEVVEKLSDIKGGIFSKQPLNMEQYGQYYGLINYRIFLQSQFFCSNNFNFLNFTARDYAIVQINNKFLDFKWINEAEKIVNFPHILKCNNYSQNDAVQIDIIVEAMGRNYFFGQDLSKNLKGLIGPVKFNFFNQEVKNWTVFPVSFSNNFTEILYNQKNFTNINQIQQQYQSSIPIFFIGTLIVLDVPVDTYISVQGWGKGIAWINGFNLGRYWTKMDPEMKLYIPKFILKKGKNEIIFLELEKIRSPSLSVKFIG